jgi:hypothetical protein
MADLRQREGGAAAALEFAILTAARTGEVIGARWSEINIGRQKKRRIEAANFRLACSRVRIARRIAIVCRLRDHRFCPVPHHSTKQQRNILKHGSHVAIAGNRADGAGVTSEKWPAKLRSGLASGSGSSAGPAGACRLLCHR